MSNLTEYKTDNLSLSLGMADRIVNKKYLVNLDQYAVKEASDSIKEMEPNTNCTFL